MSIGSLSQGRLLIVAVSARTMGYALKIALRFAAMRKQFGKPGESEEINLIEYPLHQYRLFPYVANVFAFILASNDLSEKWNELHHDLFNPEAAHKLSEVHAIISSLKSLHSSHAMKCI